MLQRPPSAAARIREQNRLAKRRQRARETEGVCKNTIFYSPTVIAALIAQSEDAKLTTEAAERESRNPKKVAVALAAVIEEWAARYLAARARGHA